MEGLENYLLGQTDELLSISSRDECQQLTLAMARQARHSLNIFSYNLEPALYDRPSFYEAARNLIGVDTNSLIRILVYDISGTVNKGHRLLDLCSRLSSRVQIRKLTRKHHHAFMIADSIGIVDRVHAERYEGTANFNAYGSAQTRLVFFNNVWEQSSRTSEIYALKI